MAKVLDGDRGKNYPNASDFSLTGHTLFLSATNVKKNDFSFETTQFITQEKSDSMGNGKVQLNDIILTSRGTVGNIVVYDEKVQSVIEYARINSGMLLLRSTKVIDPKYIIQYLKSPVGSKKLELISFGSAQPQLTKNDVINYKINLPSFEEQTKIGMFFQQLNKNIALHQRKLDLLKQLKQGYLHIMFPQKGESVPRLRFANFDSDWVLRKLEEVADIIGGGTPSTNIPEYWDGDIDWYSPIEIGNKIYATGSKRKITKLGLNKSSAKILPAHKTILFTSRAGIGDMAILKKNGSTNQGFQSLVVNDGCDVYFLYYLGGKIKRFALKHAAGSTFLEISGKELKKMKLLIPTLLEQIEIGSFIKQLDGAIILHQTKLDKLQSFKKAYLQKMFI